MWNYAYTVPENKKVRVIVHTDCKNEADDQYAVAHHLMTPRFDVKGLVAGHFWKNPQQYGELGTAQASYDEIIKVMELMGLKNQYPVKLGAPRALEDENTPIDSEGARFIIEEAMKEDKRPLYIACQGAITDVASALLMKPEIAERMTVIWIGGADYPKGGFEFNLMMDINAANVVFSSKVPVWQVPMSLYKVMAVSLQYLLTGFYFIFSDFLTHLHSFFKETYDLTVDLIDLVSVSFQIRHWFPPLCFLIISVRSPRNAREPKAMITSSFPAS